MKRYAVINENGVVENVIKANEGFSLPDKTLVEVTNCGIGWTYEDGEFLPPKEIPIPPLPKPKATEQQILLHALRTKTGLTDEDIAAARVALDKD